MNDNTVKLIAVICGCVVAIIFLISLLTIIAKIPAYLSDRQSKPSTVETIIVDEQTKCFVANKRAIYCVTEER